MKTMMASRLIYTSKRYEYVAVHHKAMCEEGMCSCMSRLRMIRKPIKEVTSETIGQTTVTVSAYLSMTNPVFGLFNRIDLSYGRKQGDEREPRSHNTMERIAIRLLKAAIQCDEVAEGNQRPSLAEIDLSFKEDGVKHIAVAAAGISELLASLMSADADEEDIDSNVISFDKMKSRLN